ncbi:TrbG/VirB9 family P-type conjugative transfer protein [Asticcacaulis sp. BYS171W]|uniref:TrbG/VirB9 family P-type conjugative transfer protein n=1 Tax=Asticcacaulis aquaticus TaxID=2984212 RepID=A0ABT5HYQ7_9CAUL|nr:TrbG/VirB9 family P-type conjugative transfer protein [Asticcacaulis aquaticus]MDC7684576.1 TrbG/VirB9 family P-type conjugative transfer protein [Asticcacaulis aquaticus]
MKSVLLSALMLTAAGSAFADGRIRTIDYTDGAVVRLDTCLGFQTMITFGDSEKIENVAIGDAAQWQATPNKRGNLIFIKPFTKSAYTNLSVVTDRRAYAFELSAKDTAACKRGEVLYDLRFRYPNDPVENPAPPPPEDIASTLPEKRNTAYTYAGEQTLVPLRMFDDGQSTYLMWAEGVAFPAIYALTDGKESLINFGYREGYIVIEQVGPAFILRRGDLKATVFNDAFVPPALDALSPQPRPVEQQPKPKKSGWFGRKEQ